MAYHGGLQDADHDSDEESVASLPPFSVSGSTRHSHTSYDVSMRSASPTPSVWSMTSSMRSQAFKQEFGRELNNYSEVYRLPADDEELDRLSAQPAFDPRVPSVYAPLRRSPTPNVYRGHGEISAMSPQCNAGRCSRRNQGLFRSRMWERRVVNLLGFPGSGQESLPPFRQDNGARKRVSK